MVPSKKCFFKNTAETPERDHSDFQGGHSCSEEIADTTNKFDKVDVLLPKTAEYQMAFSFLIIFF